MMRCSQGRIVMTGVGVYQMVTNHSAAQESVDFVEGCFQSPLSRLEFSEMRLWTQATRSVASCCTVDICKQAASNLFQQHEPRSRTSNITSSHVVFSSFSSAQAIRNIHGWEFIRPSKRAMRIQFVWFDLRAERWYCSGLLQIKVWVPRYDIAPCERLLSSCDFHCRMVVIRSLCFVPGKIWLSDDDAHGQVCSGYAWLCIHCNVGESRIVPRLVNLNHLGHEIQKEHGKLYNTCSVVWRAVSGRGGGGVQSQEQ